MPHNLILVSILLGLLSAPISLVKKPRFFWGSSGFDPISIFWMISFFLYGPVGFLISSLIGSVSIALFSREPTPLLGAILKFIGTLTVCFTLYFILFMSPNMFCSAIYFQEISIYLPSVILAAIMRCMVEVPACFFAIPYFLTISTKVPTTTHVMIEKFGGVLRYFLIMIGLNIWLTFLDTLISWLIVYPTGVYDKFAVW